MEGGKTKPEGEMLKDTAKKRNPSRTHSTARNDTIENRRAEGGHRCVTMKARGAIYVHAGRDIRPYATMIVFFLKRADVPRLHPIARPLRLSLSASVSASVSHPAVFHEDHGVGSEPRRGAHDVRVHAARLHALVAHLQPLVVNCLQGAQHDA